jgi:hypothetical protein
MSAFFLVAPTAADAMSETVRVIHFGWMKAERFSNGEGRNTA